MQIKVYALPGGQLQVMVDDASFEEAQQATQTLLAHLQASGLPVELAGQIEQHKAGVSHVHVQQKVQQS